MKHAARLGLLSLAVLSTPALADTSEVTCKRYKSRCSGDTCFQIAEGLKRDTATKALPASSTETVVIKVSGDTGSETMVVQGASQKDANSKFKTTYEYVTVTPTRITLQNRADNGHVSERMDADLTSGFYTYYAMHNDGSMKDVPLGQPYAAYFGWCDVAGTPGVAPVPVLAPAPVLVPAPGIAPTPGSAPQPLTPGNAGPLTPGADLPPGAAITPGQLPANAAGMGIPSGATVTTTHP